MINGASGKDETTADPQAESGQAPTGPDPVREKVVNLKSADPDTDLLHGPQDEGEGISQDEIDTLFD